jgi:mono/diheme cytochrome c family protein
MAVAAAVGALAVSTFVLDGPVVATYAQDPATLDRGVKVYADQRCALCHAIDGQGNRQGPLDDVGARLTADEIREWIVAPDKMTKQTGAARKPSMRAYRNLPKDDLDALVRYMESLKP